jgi:hypothetical protein
MSYHFEEQQREYLNGLYRFLINVGQKSLFDGLSKEDKQKELIYIHNKLILENPIAPKNIAPDIIYREFFHSVYYGSKEYKIFNIYQLVRSFIQWLREAETIPKLYQLSGKELPTLMPAHLQLKS